MKSQSVTAPSLTKKRYTFFTDIRRNRFSYLLILPAIAYLFLFNYIPCMCWCSATCPTPI